MSDVRTIIAIDQGTTSSRAILFDEEGTILAQQSAELPQHFPADGWVEHNPEDIWRTTVDVSWLRRFIHSLRTVSPTIETVIDGVARRKCVCLRTVRFMYVLNSLQTEM